KACFPFAVGFNVGSSVGGQSVAGGSFLIRRGLEIVVRPNGGVGKRHFIPPAGESFCAAGKSADGRLVITQHQRHIRLRARDGGGIFNARYWAGGRLQGRELVVAE